MKIIKKSICILFALIAVFALIFVACNEAGGGGNNNNNTTGGGEDVIYNWGDGSRNTPGNSPNYPGVMLALSSCPSITGTLGDISLYSQVILEADLYANAEAAATVDQKNGLAHFKILSGGNWETDSLITQKDNMLATGANTANVPTGSTGKPANILVQTAIDSGVGSINIRKLTFKINTNDSGVTLDVVYGDNYVTVDGNKAKFKNAMYSDCAIIYVFPSNFPASLSGKNLVFNFGIESHTCEGSGTPAAGAGYEHQINFQAANSDKNHFNGTNNATGQKYITLDDAASTGWDGSKGTFSVPLNDLIASSNVSGSADDIKGPFTLNAVRIANNGSTYNTAVRCKSYTLVIESVKVE